MVAEDFVELNLNHTRRRFLNIKNGVIYNRKKYTNDYFYEAFQIWLIDDVPCVYMKASNGKQEFLELESLQKSIETPREPMRKNIWTYPHKTVGEHFYTVPVPLEERFHYSTEVGKGSSTYIS